MGLRRLLNGLFRSGDKRGGLEWEYARVWKLLRGYGFNKNDSDNFFRAELRRDYFESEIIYVVRNTVNDYWELFFTHEEGGRAYKLIQKLPFDEFYIQLKKHSWK